MSVAILGERECGQQVRDNNCGAVTALANIVMSSLGPKGLDKMLVDDIGEVTITNDGATILKQLEVDHPAAKMIVELSAALDLEVGDGTTSVVLMAAELLKRGNRLIQESIHPTGVIAGYKLAMKEAVRYVEEHLAFPVTKADTGLLTEVARTTLSSKYVNSDDGHFASLCVAAMRAVEQTTDLGDLKYPVGAVNIVKAHGGSIKDSHLADGYALAGSRACQGMPTEIGGAKVALLDFALKQHRMQLGISVEVTDPTELEKIRCMEKNIVRGRVQKILDGGANVILSTQGIDDVAMKYFVDAGAMAVRRVPKKCLRRIAKMTGGAICHTLATLEGDEAFPAASLGRCDKVIETQIGDRDHIFLIGPPCGRAATLVLRAANEFVLDEVERSVHDALCAVGRALECGRACPGGGAVEAALSIYLEDFARTLGVRDQLAVAEFAEGLLVIPRCLAINAAMDASELVAKLRHVHAKAQGPAKDDAHYKWYALDLVNEGVFDATKNGLLEPMIAKTTAIRFATEAAIMILRVDDSIRLEPQKQSQEEDED